MKNAFFVAALLSMAGCAATPPQPAAPIDYGPAPTDYQAAIRTYLAAHLKDPDSAKYNFDRKPVQAWTNMQGRAYGWATCIGVNAKNNYGGYTGSQQHYFLIRDDVVIRTTSADGKGGMWDEIVANLCRSF